MPTICRSARGTPTTSASPRDAGRTLTIPYQRTIPHNLPVVDASLDFVSPPLTCLDQGTIWSQPGNLYSQIVDLSDVDNSRSMMAPGNSEDGQFRTNQVALWVQGTTHPAPLSRTKLEALGMIGTKLVAIAYAGASSSSRRIVTESDPAARFVPALPPAVASTNTEAKPLPGRKPDDPRLEATFRVILRQGTPPEEVDAKLAECRDYVKDNAVLTGQLRSAAVLGVYLIEESAAGRLKVPYGSPQVLERLETLLKDLGASEAPDRGQPKGAQPESRPQSSLRKTGGQPEVWLCAGERINDLLRPDAEWSFVKQHLSGIKLYVDQIRNHAEFLWHDVFAFNCLNPSEAPALQDWKLERTYMSSHGQPLRMAQTTRVKGHMPTVGFYLPERIKTGEESVFVRGFGATSPDRTDGSWIVTKGTLDDFLKRLEVDRRGLAARQKWARPAGSASDSRGSQDRISSR